MKKKNGCIDETIFPDMDMSIQPTATGTTETAMGIMTTTEGSMDHQVPHCETAKITFLILTNDVADVSL